jgi:hypothetical protein
VNQTLRRWWSAAGDFFQEEPERSAWHKKPLGVFLLYVFTVVLAWWNIFTPPPGEAVTILAVAAAAMTVLGEMKGKEKLAWVLLLFGFLWIELSAVRLERETQETLQAEARAEQLRHFSEIGTGIQRSIEQNNEAFAKTMTGINAGINTSTGGNSFCYAIFLSSSIGATGMPIFVHQGNFPLYGVTARFVNINEMPKKMAGPQTIENYLGSDTTEEIGDLRVAGSLFNLTWRIPISDKNHQSFRIIFDAKNGEWAQDLELRKGADGNILQALRVVKTVGKNTFTIFRKIDKGFPENEVHWPK